MQKTLKPQAINYSTFKCPHCQTTGQYESNKGEKYCKQCGTIIDLPYPFVAGIKIKTISEFQIEYKNKKEEERWKKWKKITSVHTQHG